ncbi:50S ribosomal protein L19 [bacterium]|nr:50S ribosomal protein L19 [bacterium]
MNQAKWKDTSFKVGDVVKINYIIEEGGKKRVQPFQGTVIKIRGEGDNKMFTVRKIGEGNIGIERIFPLNSPWISSLKVVGKIRNKIRRSKLYFLRKKK